MNPKKDIAGGFKYSIIQESKILGLTKKEQ